MGGSVGEIVRKRGLQDVLARSFEPARRLERDQLRITDVRCFVLRHPLKERAFLSSQAVFGDRNSLLVRIETDNGFVGWGEGGQYGPPEPVGATIDHVLKPLLIGRDPLEIDVLWERMYAFTRDYGRSSTPIEAISAIDIAL